MKAFSLFLRPTGALLVSLALLVVVPGCKKDKGEDDPIASFQFEADATDFLQVTFTNYSQNASTYAWDFGDGNTSTEENPVHTYSQAGTYTVKLTASNTSGTQSTKAELVAVVDPDAQLTLLAGSSSKTWYLQREGVALGVGPAIGDNQYWSFGGVTPLGDRPCILDDQYIFHRDGRFEFNSNNTLFVDSEGNGGWLPGVPEGCHDENEPGIFTGPQGQNLSAFANGGDYTYEFNNAAGTLTLLGSGAYIGLANKTADGDNFNPVSTKEYTIFGFSDGPVADTLQLALVGNGVVWNFYLVSYDNPADLPNIPGPKPKADFSVTKDEKTVTFTNLSKNATTYMWDFGDGMSSSQADPTHTYSADGEYTVTLTVMDNLGQSDSKSAQVVVSSSVFSPAVLSNAGGKAWELNGANSYYVGPSAGSAEWWPGLSQTDVEARPCQFNDEFIFTDGGTYAYDAKGDVFFEDFMGGNNTCIPEGNLPSMYASLASGTHAFEVTPASGSNRATVKVIGKGAFIGFAKGFNGGELNGSNSPANSITYEVVDYAKTAGAEVLTLSVDISATQDGSAWWTVVIRAKN